MQNGRRKRQSVSRKSVGSQNGPKPAKRVKGKIKKAHYPSKPVFIIFLLLAFIYFPVQETKNQPERRNPSFPGGVLLTFGQGDVGQLGLGPDIMEKGRPALIPNVDGVVDVCAGGMHTVYLNNKGEVIETP